MTEDEKLEVALEAAKSWLELIDEDSFEESWDEAAELFRSAVTKEAWVETITRTLAGFGHAMSRNKASAGYATELPGAPDGEYAIIEFATRMEKKQNAVERVVVMADPDGSWRVSGYFIR